MTRPRDIADSINRINSSAADATAMTIDSSENVGIGTSSISSLGTGITTLELKGNSASQSDRSGGIRFTRYDGSDGMYIYNADGASYIESRSTYPLLITTNGSERMRILSGGGLTFNGDTAAANALDDYEEGTWTPSAATGTLSAGWATYTKIGNLVTVYTQLGSFSDRTSTNGVGINGLPFTSGGHGSVGSVLHQYANAGGDQVVAYITSGTSQMKLYQLTANNQFNEIRHADLSSTLSQFYITITYRV
tara:strand:- start:69 stop:818 length:750 start_codon:yes stop_codon:yes gene_type:complete